MRGFGVVFLLGVTWSSQALAQPTDDASRAAARQLGYAGVDSYQAGDFAAATSKLEKAYQVLKVPTLGLWSARALIKTNHLVEGAERLRQLQRLQPEGGDIAVQQQAIVDAKAELDALTPRIPSLVITLVAAPPGEPQLSVDGQEFSSALLGEALPVNPGAHTILVRIGARDASKQVEVNESQRRRVRLHFDAQAAPDPLDVAVPEKGRENGPSARRIASYATLGLGIAGVALGATSGVLAMLKKSDLEDSGACSGNNCYRGHSDDVGSYNTLRTVSTIGFVAGAALSGVGITLLLTEPSQTRHASSGLWLRVSSRGAQLGGLLP